MDFNLLLEIAIGAAAGWYLVYGGSARSSKNSRAPATDTQIGIEGVYTPALNYRLNAAGQGLAGYLGVAAFRPEAASGDKLLAVNDVKDRTADVYRERYSMFLDPPSGSPYNGITTGVSQVVPFTKTFGACLPGTAVPGAFTGM